MGRGADLADGALGNTCLTPVNKHPESSQPSRSNGGPFPRLASTSSDELANNPTASASEDAYIISDRKKAESGRVMQLLHT